MPISYQGGQSVPALGTAGYAAAQAGSGYVPAPQNLGNLVPYGAAGRGEYPMPAGQLDKALQIGVPMSELGNWQSAGMPSTWSTNFNLLSAPTGPVTMSASSLSTPTSSFSMPSAPSYSNPGLVNNSGLVTTLADMYTLDKSGQLTAKKEEAPTEQSLAKDRMSVLQKKLEMIPQRENVLASPEIVAQNAEVQRRRQALNELTAQLNTVVAKQNQDLLQLRQTGSQEGVTEAVYGGQALTINREAAIKALPLQASISAAQGNLELAQDYLKQLTDIKTEQVENTFRYKMAQYDAISEYVTGEQKIQLENVRRDSERQYAKDQDFIKTQADLLASAVQQKAPASVVNAINSVTPQQGKNAVIMAAGKWGGDVLAQQYKQLQITQINENIAKTRAEAAALTQSSGDSENLMAYAAQYADTGKLPNPSELKAAGLSIGQVTALAKQAPKSAGTLVSKSTGVKASSLSASQEDGISALYDLTKKLDEAQTKFSELNTGFLAGVTKTIFYTKKQQEYDSLKSEISDLLSRARSGAALTEFESKTYADKLPGRFNSSFFLGGSGKTSINSLKSSIEGKLNTNLNTNNLAVYGYSKVKVNGEERTVGEILQIGDAQYKVLPDGTLTDII